jgi:multidrug resistance efflux pump
VSKKFKPELNNRVDRSEKDELMKKIHEYESKIDKMEKEHKEVVKDLLERIDFLTEMGISQRMMLEDALNANAKLEAELSQYKG